MKRFAVLLCCCISCCSLFGQRHLTDSLAKLYEQGNYSLKERMGGFHLVTEMYACFDLQNTYRYGTKGLHIAQQLHDEYMESVFYHYIASTYTFHGEYDSSLFYLNKELAIGNKLNNRIIQHRAYSAIGYLYAHQGMYISASDYYQKALQSYEKENYKILPGPTIEKNLTKSRQLYSPTRTQIITYLSLSKIHLTLQNFDAAIQNLSEALKLTESYTTTDSALFYPSIYYNLGCIYFKMENWSLSESYIYRAMACCKNNNRYLFLSNCNNILIPIYIQQKKYDKAQALALQSLAYADSIGDQIIRIKAWNNCSDICLAEKQYKKSIDYAIKAWNVDSTSFETATTTALNLAFAYSFSNNKTLSDYYLNTYKKLTAEKSNREYQQSIADCTVKYDVDKKNLSLLNLEKERKLLIGLMAAALISVISLIFLLIFQRKNSQRKKEILSQQALFEGEMKERTRIARDLHDRLGGNLAALKLNITDSDYNSQNIVNQIDTSIQEVRCVAHNLMPASLQYGLKNSVEDLLNPIKIAHFHYFGKDVRLSESIEFNLFCCIDELVTNALKHANAKRIDVQILRTKELLSLTVQDDGCGFVPNQFKQSFGLNNLQNRVASCKGRIDIFSKPNQGTEITIFINL